MNRFVVLDLETTGNSSANQDKIIEVGIVVIEDDRITDEFSTMLYPEKSIPPFITKLTGIKDEDVKDAPSFTEMADTITTLLENSYLIAHNVPFDMGFLNSELTSIGKPRLRNPVLDTVELTRILFPQAPGFKLGQLADYLKIKHDNPHRALSDAYVTAKLFLILKEKISTLPYETLQHLLKIEKSLKSDLYDILNKQMELVAFETEETDYISYKGLAFLNNTPKKREKVMIATSYGEYLDSIYEENGSMESAIKQYEKRDGQRIMSEDIYDSFQGKKHALIEAETGTGKSLAYLIPAIYEAVKTNKKIVISTYTTQLQSQLLEKEIPLVKKLISFPFKVALLKGKQHYLSIEKFIHELYSAEQDNYDIALTKAMILVWLLETETGDIDELHLPSHGQLFYRRISADTEGQADPSSPWFKYSYYQKARRKAQLADIIITNHALLCTDIFNEYQFLPKYDKVIIDEAHHLEETASKHYGLKLDYVNMQHVINQIGTFGEGKWIDKLATNHVQIKEAVSSERWNDLVSLTKYELDDLFRSIFQYVLHLEGTKKVLSDVGRIQYRYEERKEKEARWNPIIEMATRVIFYIRDLIHYLTIISQQLTDKEAKDETEHRIELLQSFIDGIEQLFLLDNDSVAVKWIEIEAYGAKNAVYLYSEPVNVSSVLQEQFFAVKESVILTSATLTMKNSFSFIQKRLGIPNNRLYSKKLPSPFSYEDQVRVMVPNDFPEWNYSNSDDFVMATCEAILSLAEITSGRMLVLFTSYDMLKKSYYLIKESMENEKFVLIAQGISSGSRERLKKNFQTFDQSILLGTSSFWEGVDIPGDDLSCLMIVRLPFQPPNHPVYEAKAQDMKKTGGNAFYDLALPNAVIRFRQGFGRLIRSNNDRGIVFVCDARMIRSSYGKYFTESIPKVPIAFDSTTELMKKAREWF
ncbi:ATP-dependent DNA helicase DinG [Ornithinibacillus sp. BX22]|uniref:3'-5' exonuclease DinG n=2 Tax=Ornithinibacillus TaxID=484508 RepID=A0A923L5V1_9BACI|nr:MULTISPECIES: ATP-dependent DNA helicase DinG [Ornithinibacillus]MBC5637050.1 ATP-dependent DNA helicase DinG [Ornithinibacillus hominis]MBS3679739.1 ATP-dependent DNA helicase DinG [Ornithinibacillus massiliensis]